MKYHQYGFLDEGKRLLRLSAMGDPLVKLSLAVDFEIFRSLLDKALQREDYGQGGRPAFDRILMFKILLLQQLYGIADDKTEYQINDRLSFQRFLGLTLGAKVPDAKTIWVFREKLVQHGLAKELFDFFATQLEQAGIITRSGSIVDASFVDVPRQRNTRDENERIKAGEIPSEWEEKPNKHRQKDTDARWTKKNNETHYGYKDHVKADAESKLIVSYTVTPASVHDSQEIVELVDTQDKEIYADSAYVGKALHEEIVEKNETVRLNIHEKGKRNCPLTEEQKQSNRAKSRIRARVEHIFGHMTQSMCGLFVRTIGIRRAACVIGLKNLAYNLSRYTYLSSCGSREAPA